MAKQTKVLELEKKADTEPPALEPALGLTLFVEGVEPGKNEKGRKKLKKKSKIKMAAGLAMLVFALLWGFFAKAQTPSVLPPLVPHLINFQSVLTDIGGVPLSDGFHNVQFRLLDVNKAPIYTETQNLESVGGVVSAMVGAQDDMGLDKLAPDQAKFLGVKVEGSTPETLLEIVSVPYSMYAEQALTVAPKSIGTEAMIPKSITADLIADDVIPTLLPTVVYADQLSSPSGATNIGVETLFVYSGGANVQGVLKDLDTAISKIEVSLNAQNANLTSKIDQKVSKTGDIMSGNLNMSGNWITNVGTPQSDNDAATKSYVDLKVSTIPPPSPCTCTGGSVSLSTAPQVVASGIVDRISSGFQLVGDYQVSGISVAHPTQGPVTISLANSTSTPYIVQVTSAQGSGGGYATFPNLHVQNLNASSFQVAPSSGEGLTSFHFAVFK